MNVYPSADSQERFVEYFKKHVRDNCLNVQVLSLVVAIVHTSPKCHTQAPCGRDAETKSPTTQEMARDLRAEIMAMELPCLQPGNLEVQLTHEFCPPLTRTAMEDMDGVD